MKKVSILISADVYYPDTMTVDEALESIEQDLNGNGTLKDGVLLHTICKHGSIILKEGELLGINNDIGR
jgi:hypothetical protein